ncbi:glycosyltransferase [Flavobacterium sp. W20_MBD1_R3]|uniref:glycosyltransferase n=1 Tax=Flavobacterium sp. W20_MBD1_R3 TaxID=3240278 RepID=UPI003F937FF1
MISIIICCRTQIISNDLSENIKNTIGCEYELIVIDNSENKYSIFEAYNLGIEKSLGECLCFIHDDILFHTEDWGCILESIYNSDEKIGLIGLAGSKVKTKMPSAWFNCHEDESVYNLIQHVSKDKKENWFFGFEKPREELVVIDGFFMAMKKECHVYFNTFLKGFHNYDLNISLEVLKAGYKIIGTNEIIVEHYSVGNLNSDWVKSTYQIHKLYSEFLPLTLYNNKENKDHEIKNAKEYINKSVSLGMTFEAFKVWGRLFLLNPLTKYHISFLLNVLSQLRRKK